MVMTSPKAHAKMEWTAPKMDVTSFMYRVVEIGWRKYFAEIGKDASQTSQEGVVSIMIQLWGSLKTNLQVSQSTIRLRKHNVINNLRDQALIAPQSFQQMEATKEGMGKMTRYFNRQKLSPEQFWPIMFSPLHTIHRHKQIS